jgi:hypothetical protein
LEDAFSKKYSWDLPMSLMPSESLLARTRREFEKVQPTFFPLAKVRSAEKANRMHPETRQRLTNTFAIVTVDDDSVDPSGRFRVMTNKLEILANCWGLAGVTAPQGSTDPICHWQQALTYHRTLVDRSAQLLDFHAEAGVTQYFVACEQSFRNHAIDMVRRKTNPVQWGAALAMTLKEFPVTWSDHAHLLSKASKATAAAAEDVGVPPRLPISAALAVPGSSSSKPMAAKGKLATVLHTRNKMEICKHWNDSRGCANPCKRGKVHACDVELAATGKACEKKHTRAQHDEAAHGVAARRPA